MTHRGAGRKHELYNVFKSKEAFPKFHQHRALVSGQERAENSEVRAARSSESSTSGDHGAPFLQNREQSVCPHKAAALADLIGQKSTLTIFFKMGKFKSQKRLLVF